MGIGENLRYFFKRALARQSETEPEKAYDLWAFNYDNQPHNLMLDLDEELFSDILRGTKIENRLIADVGCGTGRHWQKIMDRNPSRLIGFDISEGMLKMLQQKFFGAEVYHLHSNKLEALKDNSCDLVISTLAIAHIKKIEEALKEWYRVLKPGGEIIITDYHPDALDHGANRTFRNRNRLIAVRNYIHPVEKIISIAKQLDLKQLRFTERMIDASVKNYYEQQNAMYLYERFEGIALIYGIHLKKKGA